MCNAPIQTLKLLVNIGGWHTRSCIPVVERILLWWPSQHVCPIWWLILGHREAYDADKPRKIVKPLLHVWLNTIIDIWVYGIIICRYTVLRVTIYTTMIQVDPMKIFTMHVHTWHLLGHTHIRSVDYKHSVIATLMMMMSVGLILCCMSGWHMFRVFHHSHTLVQPQWNFIFKFGYMHYDPWCWLYIYIYYTVKRIINDELPTSLWAIWPKSVTMLQCVWGS